MMTRFAPPFRWALAFALLVNSPVLSKTYCTPSSPHGSFAGSRSASTLIRSPFTTIASPSTFTSPSNLPCTVSYRVLRALYEGRRTGEVQIVALNDLHLSGAAAFVQRAQDVA